MNYAIDQRYHLAYRRLSKRFRIETLERHWDRIVGILTLIK